MSLLVSSPHLAQAEAPVDPRAHWITPKEQLDRLHLPIAKEVSRLTPLIPAIGDLVAQWAMDDASANWYKAQDELRTLPRKIPPLPRNIHQILDSKCPIYGDQAKSDGTFYKVKDTHFLSLIPEEFGSLNHLERDILKPYGERVYAGNENPLQFRYFWNTARQEHADVPFSDTHWVLMTKDVLPGSRNKAWNKQVALVEALSEKAFANYEVPTLQQSFAAITTHMVATGERLYQAGSGRNRDVYTYTRVKETTEGWHLAVGGFAPSGVSVSHNFDYDHENIGVGGLRKF